MIPTYEKQTDELTEKELKIVPFIVSKLSLNIGKKKSVTNGLICKALKSTGINITQPRFRKIIQYIRLNGLIPCLVATSKGYYVAETKQDCLEHIEMYDKRINSETLGRDALAYQMKQKFN